MWMLREQSDHHRLRQHLRQGNGYDYGHWLAKDATAWGLIDIIGTHEYDTQKAEPWPSDVDGGKRSKTV